MQLAAGAPSGKARVEETEASSTTRMVSFIVECAVGSLAGLSEGS